jgi:hypothetical protein
MSRRRLSNLKPTSSSYGGIGDTLFDNGSIFDGGRLSDGRSCSNSSSGGSNSSVASSVDIGLQYWQW